MISKGSPSQKKWNTGAGGRHSSRAESVNKRVESCLQRIISYFRDIIDQIIRREWTPRLVAILFLFFLLLLLLCYLLYQIISSIFLFNSVRSFLLFPPACEECLKRNPQASAYRPPSELFVHLS